MSRKKEMRSPKPLKIVTPRRTTHSAFRIPQYAYPLALMALALAVYLPALGAGYLWDDDAMTTSPLVASWGGLLKMWIPPSLAPRETHFWPLVYSTFWLEYRLWGLHPFGYHLVNILLHGLCGVLLWRVLKTLNVPGAWLAGALFLVHPVHAESVAWVIERKDVLSGALALGAALAFLKFGMRNGECGNQNLESQNSQPATHTSQLVLAFLLFAGALLSKSIVVGLPIVLLVLIWFRRGRPTLREAVALAAMFALAAALTLADLKFVKTHLLESVASGLSWPQRALLASRAAWFYLLKLAWPYPLAPFYPKWDVSPANPLAWLPVAAGLGVMVALWSARRRFGRGPFAAAVIFCVLLAPALGLVDYGFMGYSWVADRFQYLASAAPLALAAAALGRFVVPASDGRTKTKTNLEWSPYFIAALLVILSALCFHRAGLYKDSVTLYSAAARAYPQCWGAHYVRGFSMLERGDDSLEALKSLETARRLHPDFIITTLMAQVQTALGQYPEAEASFKKTLELKPDDGEAHSSYGVLLNAMGRSPEAVAHFNKALELDRNNAKAMAGLGVAFKNQKKYEEAAGYLAEATKREPATAEFQKEFGVTLSMLGRPGDAAAAFERAREIEPSNPDNYVALGRLYEMLGKPADAARRYREALQLDPANAMASERLNGLNSGTVH